MAMPQEPISGLSPPDIEVLRVAQFISGCAAVPDNNDWLGRLPATPPYADAFAMQLHIDEISLHVQRGAHAALLPDYAGWHTTERLIIPQNMTLIFLPSRSPELNPVEDAWQCIRQNWHSNRLFDTYDAIIDAACQA